MKALLTLALTMLCGLTMAQNFEGKVVYKMDVTGLPPGATAEQMAQFLPKQQIAYYKNGAMRTETVGGMMNMTILVPASGEGILFINDDKKQVLMMDKKQVDEQMSEAKKMEIVTKNTGEKREISGHKCTKYIVTATQKKGEKKTETVIWAADDLQAPRSTMVNPHDALMKEIKGLPMITTIQQGPMNILLTATEVKAMPLDASLFVKPADYTVEPFSQAAMMKGMR